VADWALQELPELQPAHDLIRRVLQQRSSRSRFIRVYVTSDELDTAPGAFFVITRQANQLLVELETGRTLLAAFRGSVDDIPPDRPLSAYVVQAAKPTYVLRAMV
jgi:hypothetical protein